jgi:energy-coupling factor transport system ATP-binding protein
MNDQSPVVDVSLMIARGSVAAIIGVTESGKSTLVQHFNDLLRPTSGRVVVDGVDVRAADSTDLRVLRQRVGMLFQFPDVFTLDEAFAALKRPGRTRK